MHAAESPAAVPAPPSSPIPIPVPFFLPLPSTASIIYAADIINALATPSPSADINDLEICIRRNPSPSPTPKAPTAELLQTTAPQQDLFADFAQEVHAKLSRPQEPSYYFAAAAAAADDDAAASPVLPVSNDAQQSPLNAEIHHTTPSFTHDASHQHIHVQSYRAALTEMAEWLVKFAGITVICDIDSSSSRSSSSTFSPSSSDDSPTLPPYPTWFFPAYLHADLTDQQQRRFHSILALVVDSALFGTGVTGENEEGGQVGEEVVKAERYVAAALLEVTMEEEGMVMEVVGGLLGRMMQARNVFLLSQVARLFRDEEVQCKRRRLREGIVGVGREERIEM
ncbi:hypothetical protein AJ79_03399 [Helicocarpus griseus UAMH5409]|uniref:Uncharacterized protein n=1 Tax=Helicocarpus griseus UAMH5409 TaxID=1447875 RepID=A0A2B7XYH6_9EURO|nr:hypothetical protein AJ79_03399 [Helicocarpus griseus UAMH5409]